MLQLGLHSRSYPLHSVVPYINWLYFFHAWGFAPAFAKISEQCACEGCRQQWIHSFSLKDQPKAYEAERLWKEAQRMLQQLDASYRVHGVVRLVECNAEGNGLNLWLPGNEQPFYLPLLRQQQGKPPYRCLCDFIRPQGTTRDVIGLFATSVDGAMEQLFANEDYKHLLVQTLADRLAEAMAEKLHEEIRRDLWGYAPLEQLTPRQLNNEEFQGIRPAVGYPSLPDISLNRLLSQLLPMDSIGIQLTEHAMMIPHASVSGLMIAHPQSHYFAVGPIGEDQLQAYARLRGCEVKEIRTYLEGNLS